MADDDGVQDAQDPPEAGTPTLHFYATLTAPDMAAHFLGTGGGLGAAAAPWVTNFAVSGDDGVVDPATRTRDPAVGVTLYQNQPTKVSIPLYSNVIDPRDKLIIENQRQGSGINGTYGSFYAGSAAQYLQTILMDGEQKQSTSISLTYQGRAQDGVVTITDAHFTGGTLAVSDPPLRDVARTEKAMGTIKTKMDVAWVRRTKELPSEEEELAKLTKILTKSAVGVHESCYLLVHDNLNVRYPFPLESLEDLFEQALHINVGPAGRVFSPAEYDEIMHAAKRRGLSAAGHADRIAMATSMIVSYLMPYKSDGYGYLAPGAPSFVCAESWLRRHASPIHMNDCENAAKLAISIFETIRYDPAVLGGKFPHLEAVHNIIVPYYTWGLSIVGAGGAEASSGANLKAEDGGCHVNKNLNGHAIALLLPTAQLLTALDAGAKAHVVGEDKTRYVVERAHQAAYATRFDAMFTEEMIEKHYAPSGEEAWYRSRRLLDQPQPDAATEAIAERLRKLPPLSIEGTTPSSGYLCGVGAAFGGGEALPNGVRLDNCGEAAIGPSVARCLKMLASGPLTNRFYQVLCEFHVPSSNPLYADERVRAADVAASQFLFSPMHHTDDDDVTLHQTGVPVSALHNKDKMRQAYYVVPHATFSADELPDLDYAAAWALRDEMPRDAWTETGEAFAINARSAAMYKHNIERLLELNAKFKNTAPPRETHSQVYILPLAALVNNEHAIDNFCKHVEEKSTFASVEISHERYVGGIRNLMKAPVGNLPAVFARVYTQLVIDVE